MPRSRSRGGWQMRGGRCMTNLSRPVMTASGAMETVGGDHGMFTVIFLSLSDVHLSCLL